MQINSFDSARDFLSKGRDTEDRPLPGRSTRLQVSGEGIAVRYHDTDVLTFLPNGKIMLDSGGYHTATTKTRINDYLPSLWFLYQEKGIWYLQRGYFNDNPDIWPFADGMILDPATGQVTGEGEDPASLLKMKKSARAYAKRYIAALLAGDVPMPSGGDCWYCLMREVGSNKPLGELSGSDHIISHIDEDYFVPSLIVRAIEVFPVGPAIHSALYDFFNGSPVCDWLKGVSAEQLTRSLTRYLYRCLGLAA